MGFTISMEVESGKECPYWFTRTDSKSFARWLLEGHIWRNEGPDLIGKLGEHLNLDLEAIQKVASEGYSLEDYLAWAGDDEWRRKQAEEDWRRDVQRNKEAWQSPDRLIECLQAFIQALDSHPNICSELGIEQPYFVDGFFRQDLTDLIQMACWAKESGEQKLRLVWLM